MPRRFLLMVLILAACSTPDERQQTAELKEYPPHQLALGQSIAELQKTLTGHTKHIDPVVTDRLYRIVPLKAFGLEGFGSVELGPDGKSRAYFWSTDLDVLPTERRSYFTKGRPNEVQFAACLRQLSEQMGSPQTLEPYPNEKWYVWTSDSAVVNLTYRKGVITFTKTQPKQEL